MAAHGAGTHGRLVLVTGVPTTGKSTLCNLLLDRGINAVDGDHPSIMKHNGFWNRKSMKKLLRDDKELYLMGIAVNGPRYLNRFDKVYYIKGEREIINSRVGHRGLDMYGDTEIQRRILLVAAALINFAFEVAAKLSSKFEIVDPSLTPEQAAQRICKEPS